MYNTADPSYKTYPPGTIVMTSTGGHYLILTGLVGSDGMPPDPSWQEDDLRRRVLFYKAYSYQIGRVTSLQQSHVWAKV